MHMSKSACSLAACHAGSPLRTASRLMPKLHSNAGLRGSCEVVVAINMPLCAFQGHQGLMYGDLC